MKCFDEELQERIALKLLKPDYSSQRDSLTRFREEVRLGRHLKHPNLCRIHDISTFFDGRRTFTFLTMEMLDGVTLHERLQRLSIL